MIRTLLYAAVVVFAGVAMVVAAMPSQANEQLKGSWLQKNLPGNYTLVIYGFDVGVTAAANGNLKLTFMGDQLNGKWSVKGEKLCVTLIENGKSESACSPVQYDGKKYYSAAGVRFYVR